MRITCLPNTCRCARIHYKQTFEELVAKWVVTGGRLMLLRVHHAET